MLASIIIHLLLYYISYSSTKLLFRHLTFVDVICVDNPERVQNLRSELMAALVTATSSHQKTGPGGPRRDPQRMGHLLLLLPHIREASTMVIVHLFHLQRRKAVHVGALLGELLAGTEARLGQCISGTIGMGDCSAQPLL